jgi:hypothetical protein
MKHDVVNSVMFQILHKIFRNVKFGDTKNNTNKEERIMDRWCGHRLLQTF